MKKLAAIFVLCAVLLFSLIGCSSKYPADGFIGKNSAQIEAEYGAFDCSGMPISEDGLYRNTSCGYTVKEARVGFLGTYPEVLLFITFDENGIAVSCEEGYRPGG